MEQVKSYKYLRSIVNGDNSIGGEIKERIALGSKAYYANQKKLQCILKSKKDKVI